jgi:drug/metabolite transporter (DMT)-like permease
MSALELPRSRARNALLWAVMLCAAVVNQYLAERTAGALQGQPFGVDWLAQAVASPWLRAWVACEILTFAAWMSVLADASLSQAFPMTAGGYVLVVALGWMVFGEPVRPAELAGGAAILAGVWLIGEPERAP